jgi:toxin FitB
MYVLDTNIISELIRPRPNDGVVQWIGNQSLSYLYTTAVTKAEIYYGVHILPEGKRRTALERALNQIFNTGLQNRILEFNSNSAMAFAMIASNRKKAGIPISNADAQIAAICSQHGYQLVTRNVSDFVVCGIEVINPFSDSGGL